MRKYDLVLLDMDETLFDFPKGERQAIFDTGARFGIAVTPAMQRRYHAINRAFWTMLERGQIGAEELRVKRFSDWFLEFGITGVDPAAFNEGYIDGLKMQSMLVPGALSLCRYLKKNGYGTAIATNGRKMSQESRLERSKIRGYIDLMVTSEEAGAPKPAPDVFEAILRRSGVKRERAILIGDSLEADIAGAAGCGIDTIWYNPKQKENRTAFRPTHTVRLLREVHAII